MRHLDQDESVSIPGTEDGTAPFFSTDGEWVGFFTDTLLKKVRLDGVGASTLAEVVSPINRAKGSWRADGFIVFQGSSGGLMQIQEDGGVAEALTTIDPDGNVQYHLLGQRLPDS